MIKRISGILLAILVLELLPIPGHYASTAYAPVAYAQTFDPASSSTPYPDPEPTEGQYAMFGQVNDPSCTNQTIYISADENDGQQKGNDWQGNGNQWGFEGNPYDAAFRFTNVQVPQGEQINSAFLEVHGTANQNGPTSSIAYGLDEDDTPTFSDGNLPLNRTFTTSSLNISNVPLIHDYNEFNVTPIVQEILNRGGWSSGNHLGIVFDYTQTGSGNQAAAAFIDYETSATSTTYLVINRHCTDNSIQNISYEYNANGNITRIEDTSGTATAKTTYFTYDDLNRLLTASTTNATSGVNYSHSYTYSAIGNITASTPAGSYVYGSSTYANPHAATSINGLTYAYDNNGNLTSDSVWSHTWDYRNRLIQSSATSTTTYGYDHTNMRVKLVSASTTLISPFSGYSTENGTAVKYISAGGQLLATIRGTGASSTWYAVHTDHLGSTEKITDSNGAIQETTDYFPYGAERQHIGSLSDRKGFIGVDTDSDTGLSQTGARYYSSAISRFISQDPMFWQLGLGREGIGILADPQQLNSYSYARNNPIVFKDPDGKEIIYGNQTYSLWTNAWFNTGLFILEHPGIARRIGSADATGKANNISTYAGNFSINLTQEGFEEQSQEGTERNALRHVIWQGLIANQFGNGIATQVGNAHEWGPPIMNSNSGYSTRGQADQIADISNNQIGRSIVSGGGQNATAQQLVQSAWSYFYNTGLYVVQQNSNGGFSVVQQKISEDVYKKGNEIIKNLGPDGHPKK